MKVYLPEGRRRALAISVQPGNEIRDCTDFFDRTGKAILFRVVFTDGCALVSDPIGRYMIGKKLATRSRVIVPDPRIEMPRRRPHVAGRPDLAA